MLLPMAHSLSFIKSRLEGAQSLIHATHDYVKWQAPLDVKHMSPDQLSKVSAEAMRVTVRLTQVIAWLLLEKAVLTGEISRKEALSEEFRVLKDKRCLKRNLEEDEELPPRLRELLKESRGLYVRVLRLDEVGRQQRDFLGHRPLQPIKLKKSKNN